MDDELLLDEEPATVRAAHTNVEGLWCGKVRHGRGELELIADNGEFAVVRSAVAAHQAIAERLDRVRVAAGLEAADRRTDGRAFHTVLLLSAMPVGGSLTSRMPMARAVAKVPPCPSLASTQIVLLGVALSCRPPLS